MLHVSLPLSARDVPWLAVGGRSPGYRLACRRAFPGPLWRPSGVVRLAVPVTVAGPRRTFTGLPLATDRCRGQAYPGCIPLSAIAHKGLPVHVTCDADATVSSLVDLVGKWAGTGMTPTLTTFPGIALPEDTKVKAACRRSPASASRSRRRSSSAATRDTAYRSARWADARRLLPVGRQRKRIVLR